MLPLLQEEMPKQQADKVVDTLRLDLKASDREVFETTLARMKEEDVKTDAEKVERLMREYRARGLACAGRDDTLEALANGQVEELFVSTSLEDEHEEEELVEAILATRQ